MLKKQTLTYKDGNVTLNGYYVYDETVSGKRPAVIVSHDWTGQNPFAREKADKLAELGYVGFALDMYGEGKTGSTKEEKSALIQPFVQNRQALLKRMLAAYETVKTFDNVDNNRIGAIGFCFGGLCVLDLARSGTDVKGVVSFHGLLNAPEPASTASIKAKILALHGFDDPMATPEQAIAFGHEMTKRKANWQLDMYGHTVHAFTNPEANDPSFGTVYNQQAATRSWIAMHEFFREIFTV